MQAPKKLYKYVEPERVDILENNLIRFTQPSAPNDPFKLRPLFEELFTEEDLSSLTKPSFDVIEEGLRKEYLNLPADQQAQMTVEQLIEAVRANPQLVEMQLKKIEPQIRKKMVELTPGVQKKLSKALQARVGILSLSESIEHPSLWDHYSSSHKGFVIELDATHEFFNCPRSESDGFFRLREVTYANRSTQGRILSELKSEDVLVSNEASWSYEKEWRMLLPLESAVKILADDGDEIYLCSIPASAITGIIMGASASSQLHQEIMNLLQLPEFNHIRLTSASLDSSNQTVQVNYH